MVSKGEDAESKAKDWLRSTLVTMVVAIVLGAVVRTGCQRKTCNTRDDEESPSCVLTASVSSVFTLRAVPGFVFAPEGAWTPGHVGVY